MNELALFAGFGGGILGGHLLGWKTVCAVEKDAGRARILAARQNDGLLPLFPIWSDVATFDGTPWRGLVDVVTGGSPCQGFSIAGQGLGLDDPRSKLILEVLRITDEVRPRFVFLENSPVIRRKGLALVIGRFAALGYDCRWDTFTVAGVGGHHLRKRLFLVAHSHENQCSWKRIHSGSGREGKGEADTQRHEQEGAITHLDEIHGISGRLPIGAQAQNSRIDVIATDTGETGLSIPERARRSIQANAFDEELRQAAPQFHWWPSPPDMVRMVHGVPRRMERIEGLGDAQVPRVVQAAWTTLTKGWL